MKIAVIGSGSIGKRHIGNLIARGIAPADITAMDTREDRRQEVADRFGVENVVATFDEVAAQTLDGAIICSPTSLHIQQGLPLAEKGVHLMIEKPLDAVAAGGTELAKVCDDKGAKVVIAYPFRFSEHGRKLKELVAAQVVGRPLFVRGEFSEYLPDWHPWEDYRSFYMAKVSGGGGSLLDQSHIMDMCHWLCGDVAEVFAVNSRVSDLEVETDDLAEMVVKFTSGLVGNVHQDMFGRKHAKSLEVKCAHGNIWWNVYDLSVTVFDRRTEETRTYGFAKDHQIMYLNEMDHFLALCRGEETESQCTLAEGIHGMEIIEAARRSAESGAMEKVAG